MKATKAVEKVVSSTILPFYKSARLPCLARSTIHQKALAMYELYASLHLNRSPNSMRSANYERNCEEFASSLDSTFCIKPDEGKLTPEQRQLYSALEVRTKTCLVKMKLNNFCYSCRRCCYGCCFIVWQDSGSCTCVKIFSLSSLYSRVSMSVSPSVGRSIIFFHFLTF